MSVNDESAATRQFVASSGAVSSRVKQSSLFATGWLAAFIALFFVVHGGAAIAIAVSMVLIGVAWGAYDWLRWHRKILIGATSDGVTVNLRRGDVFSLVDAELGVWLTMGVALHLQSGSRGFVLGGRDRRISPAAQLDAPPVQTVDAWLWAADFDELLSMGKLDLRGPARGEPSRCLLYTNPQLAEEVSSLAVRKHIQLQKDAWRPQLAIDVTDDAIRVIEPNSDSLSASASIEMVTATPVTFWTDSGDAGGVSTTTGMVVSVPGLQPLSIGCRDVIQLKRRFWWSADVPVQDARAAYVVSGADWLTLVEKLGLASYLGTLDQQA